MTRDRCDLAVVHMDSPADKSYKSYRPYRSYRSYKPFLPSHQPITEARASDYGDGFAWLSTGAGEPFIFVAARLSSPNMSLSVESTRVESLVKTL